MTNDDDDDYSGCNMQWGIRDIGDNDYDDDDVKIMKRGCSYIT